MVLSDCIGFAPQVWVSNIGLQQRGICKHSGGGWLPGNQCSSSLWLQPASTRLHTQKELHLNIDLALKGFSLHYPHCSDKVSVPAKEERKAVRTQADKQCRFQGQPMVLRVTLSGPGAEAKPAPQQLWTVGHVQQQQSCQSECQHCQAKSHQWREEGRREAAFEWVVMKEWQSSLVLSQEKRGRNQAQQEVEQHQIYQVQGAWVHCSE